MTTREVKRGPRWRRSPSRLGLVFMLAAWASAGRNVHTTSGEKGVASEVERAWERLERTHGRVAVWAHEDCTVFTDLRVARQEGVLQVRSVGFLRPPLRRHAGCVGSTLNVDLAGLGSAEYASRSGSTPGFVTLQCRPEVSCGRTAFVGHSLSEEALDEREEVPVFRNVLATVFGFRPVWNRIGIPAAVLPGDARQFVADLNTVRASLPTRTNGAAQGVAVPDLFGPFRRHPVGTHVCRTTSSLFGLLTWREAGVVESHGPSVPGDRRGRRNTIRVRLDRDSLGWGRRSGALTDWSPEFEWARCADVGPR